MASEKQQQSCTPSNPFCENGCGFYGNPTTRNLCSKCYRSYLQEQEQEITAAASQTASQTATCSEPTTGGPPKESQGIDEKPVQAPADVSATPRSDDGCSTRAVVAESGSDGDPAHAVTPIGESLMAEDQVVEEKHSRPVQSSSPAKRAAQFALLREGDCVTTIMNRTDDNDSGGGGGVDRSGGDRDAESPLSGDGKRRCLSEGVRNLGEREQENKSRCWKCKKRVGLLGFPCRCGYSFCDQHRYADTHGCDFDYMSFDREQLSRANQKIVAEKIQKI